MEFFYTDERNAQIVIYLLKAHGIKKVIASPGTTNICLVSSMQQDPFFEIYSAADERSAGYIACGLSVASGEPVVLSCTGATASRNYMPALTEAFYRHIPILAITSSRPSCRIGHNIDQVTDRTLLPRDIAKLSVQMPLINTDEDEWAAIIACNKAILELRHGNPGPVHINLETAYSRNYGIKELPEARAIFRYYAAEKLPEIAHNRVAVFVGAHHVWTKELKKSVEDFCEKYDAVVLTDHTSNYNGKRKVLVPLISQQGQYDSIVHHLDLVIHIGDVGASLYDVGTKEVWRVNLDGKLRDPFKKLTKVFEMREVDFFMHYSAKKGQGNNSGLWSTCQKEASVLRSSLSKTMDGLPFSNVWIAGEMSKCVPKQSCLHFGIQNSLRCWNFYELDPSIDCSCNTGGFGIDGCISTAIGAALSNPNRLCYCMVGDLAFFYDMNSLGNRHVGNNLRILLVNNGKGCEFKLSTNPGYLFGKTADEFIAAGGHYGNKSATLVKHYAEDLGFLYLSAATKKEFLDQVEKFTDVNYGERSILFEVFTETDKEDEALSRMWYIIADKKNAQKNRTKSMIKKVIGEAGVQLVRRLRVR